MTIDEADFGGPEPSRAATTEAEVWADLIDQAIRSVKWSLLYNITPRLVTPLSTMVLAALLTPADFGLVAISTFLIALARLVVEMGMGKAVIQMPDHVREAASTGFWTSMILSGALYLALWIAAPALAVAYKNGQVVHVVRVSALALPLSSLISIPSALLRRDLKFRPLFWINTSLLVVSAIASVFLALLGAGAWAMIWGQLIGMAASALLTWSLARWRPGLVLDRSLLRSLAAFGSWVMISGFQKWLFLYAGNSIAGLFMGVDAVGVFSLGFNVAILIPFFLMSSLTDVAYPSFCKMQSTPSDIGASLLKVQAMAAATLIPLGLGLAVVAPTVVRLLYGAKWDGLGAVIAILVIMPGMGHLFSVNEAAYQAIGRPDLWAKVEGFSLLVILPLLWIMAHFGLMPLTWARFGGGWLLPLANIYVASRVLKVRVRDQFDALAVPLGISIGISGTAFLAVHFGGPFVGPSGWLKLASVIAACGAAYFALLRRFARNQWDRIFQYVPRLLS
jgi:PST family polysaccharide transporter